MCGIIGQTKGTEAALRAGVSRMPYRGPDAEGFFSDSAVALGHVRLSIIDLDARSNQPFKSTDGMLEMVYNGEIYNYRELREELSRVHGVRFRTESDTEAIIEGYRVWKEGLLPRLRGMFAFAIYDRTNGTLFLARDHAGIKPLYYAQQKGKLYFASEAKAVADLLRSDGVQVRISEEAVGIYLVLGNVPSPMTLAREIRKVPRSSWCRYEIEHDSLRIERWEPVTAAAESVGALQDMVRQSVLEHTIADVPVGVFFSGGIDSSVVALSLHEAGKKLTTYSVRVDGRAADEPYFRAIAEKLGVDAQVHDFGVAEFDRTFEHVLSKMDDPISDPSIFPTAFISQIAAKDVKVVLSGEGGDELFFGYDRAIVLGRMKAHAEAYGPFEAAEATFPPFAGKRALFASLGKVLHRPVSYYLSQTGLAYDAVPSESRKAAHALLAREDPTRLDRDWYLENMLLRKGDMATMYASIEGRVPLLGAQLWTNAPRFETDNLRTGKDVLKDMLRPALSDELVDRPKSGFGIPLGRLRRESAQFEPAIQEAVGDLGAKFPAYLPVFNSARENAPLSYGLVALHRSIRTMGL